MIDSIPNNQTHYPTTEQHISRERTYPAVISLSIKGRMGRFPYFFYSIISPFLLFWVMAASSGIIGKMGGIGAMVANILLLLTVLSMMYLLILLTIKRCHDFNASGWVSALIFIPFACLLFWLIPGDNETNKYGVAPEAPSNLLITGCFILITLLVATITYTTLTKML